MNKHGIRAAACWMLLAGSLVTGITQAASEQGGGGVKIAPGDDRIRLLEFAPFEAHYTSRSSTTGAFVIRVRSIDEGQAISLIDINPMADNVIVAQRRINARTLALEFATGPLFSWGSEYVVQQMSPAGYDWVRVPIGGGEPMRTSGEFRYSGVTSDMFSPTLAALMPLSEGERIALPVAVPRKDGSVSDWWEDYRVLRQQTLQTPAGLSCECWVLEKAAPGGGTTHLWISDKPPFVFKRSFDQGGAREFVSELLQYRTID